MAKQRILVIEDEHALQEILTYNLQAEGFEVLSATDGYHGFVKAQTSLPDLIVLDLMLPSMDGLTICRQLRSDPRTKNIRVLMLTAKSEEVDEVVGFSMGADDYVAKPFKVKPLLSRIKALLRRPSAEAGKQDVIVVHGIEVDRLNHSAKLDDVELALTPTEFKLLWTLGRQPGRTYSRLELLDQCRGEDANALERTIDVHIRALRSKLGSLADVVSTVRGIGYRVVVDRQASSTSQTDPESL